MGEIDEMFTTAVMKLERAGEHFEELEQLLIKYANSNPARVILSPSYYNFTNPPTSFIKVTTTVVEPPPVKIKSVLGDFFHNLRSALDTVFFPLVEGKFENKRHVQFIIGKDEERFNEEFEKRFSPHLNKHTISAIKDAKPFKEGNALLYMLSELNNIDKHRYQIVASTDGGTITREELMALVPPGTKISQFHSIVLGGSLMIRVGGEWSEPKNLQNFISNTKCPPLPAMVFLKSPEQEYLQEILQICRTIKQEVETLVQKIISANK